MFFYHFRVLFIILLLVLFPLFAASADLPNDFSNGYTELSVSPDEKYLAFNIENAPGLYIRELSASATRLVASGRAVAYRANWSPDGRYLAFKNIDERGQTPCIYDTFRDKISELSQPAQQCGVPSFGNRLQLAFTTGKMLFVTDIQGNILRKTELENYANLTPLSADGEKAVYNDLQDRLYLLDFVSGKKAELFEGRQGLFGPRWNRDDSAVAASSLNGEVFIHDLNTGKVIAAGPGRHPSWSADGAVLYFSKYSFIPQQRMLDADIYRINRDGSALQKIDDGLLWADFPVATKKGNLLLSDRMNGRLLEAQLKKSADGRELKIMNTAALSIPFFEQGSERQKGAPSINTQDAVFFDIPYVNQRYDTPDWFNGNSACGATSAIMCIGYYDLAEDWPLWVSSPYRHLSPLGNYICSIYSYNDYTFNIWASDPNGTKGYGGFGHIVRNGSEAWSDTKGNMADYAKKHGLSSYVDWYPSRTKVMNEVNAKKPFVLLNSLTRAGHYISVIGYEQDAGSVIVNDPYGNKNNGYANFYGRRSTYDWPGYSNGNENLNTVWCFIYFRGDPPAHPDFVSSSVQVQDSIHLGAEFRLKTIIANRGDGGSEDAFAALILSDDLIYDYYDRELELIPMGQIEAGDSLMIDRNFVIRDSLVSNYYCLGIYADYDSTNREMVRENNDALVYVKISGYARINAVEPDDGDVIHQSRPIIYAKYREKFGKIDSADVHLFLDKKDISGFCSVTNKKISYTPQQDLSAGAHYLRVEVINSYGLQSNMEWSFTIEPQTAIENDRPLSPEKFSLQQNYPNPFNAGTKIEYRLSESSITLLEIYNVLGMKVRTLVNKIQPAGTFKLNWNGRDDHGKKLSSGLYMLKLSANGQNLIRRMLYIK